MKQLLVFFKNDYNHPKARPEDPYRFIPMSYRFRKLLNAATIFGLLWFAGSLFFTYLSIEVADFKSFSFSSDARTATAIVTQVSPTNHEGIWQYYYRYNVSGDLYEGSSYDGKSGIKNNSYVEIEYERKAPSNSRIKNMRMKPELPWIVIFTLPFVGVGFLVVYLAIKSAIDNLTRIRNGVVVQAKVNSKIKIEPIDSEDSESYDLEMEFTTLDNVMVKSIINESNFDKIKTIETARIVYLPWSPKSAIFLKSLSDYEIQILLKS